MGWNGTLNDIDNMRCDGLVEMVYEWNDVDAWGKIVSGNTHYDFTVQAYLDEHNAWRWGDDPEHWEWDMWSTCLPVTQAGVADEYIDEHYPDYSGNDYEGNVWDSAFGEQRVVAPTALSPEEHSHYE